MRRVNMVLHCQAKDFYQKFKFIHTIFLSLYITFFYVHKIIIIKKMLFKNLLEASNQIADNQLLDMQKQLRTKIQKAKSLATTCKVTKQADQVAFATSSSGQLIFPDFKAQINYNQQFWKTYLKNQISFALIKELSQKTNSLQDQVKQIEGLQQQYFKCYKLKNRKKNRRLAVEIQKSFTCPYEKCYKVYGSDVSLNLHIKLKHNGGNKTDRQKLAEQICIAQEKGDSLPQMRLNLPPGYLQEFKVNYFSRKQNQAFEDSKGQKNQQNGHYSHDQHLLEDDQ